MVPSDPPAPKKVRFYRTELGKRVVEEELTELGDGPRAELLGAIHRRRTGTHFEREDEQVQGRLRAVRATFDGCEYRALYALVGSRNEVLLALHAINKKKGKLPKRVIDLAKRRLKDWERRGRC